MAQETQQMRTAREQAEKTGVQDHEWPRDAFGSPMVKISCAAAELIPTAQFANITVGPIVVTRFVIDASEETLMEEIRRTQKLCEAAVTEDRQTLHEQIRARAGQTGQ